MGLLGLMAQALVMAYQMLGRGLLPAACRYPLSCSDYMLRAIQEHGPVHGIRLGLKRLSACHPFSKSYGT